MTKRFLCPIALLVFAVGAGTASAERQTHAVATHHLAAFAGATLVDGDAHTTIGAEYELRLPMWHKRIGVGALAEFVAGDESELIAGAVVYVHPWQGMKLFGAPGVAHAAGHSEFLVRIGAAYDFHVGSFSITPTVATDFVDGHTTVVGGIALGLGF